MTLKPYDMSGQAAAGNEEYDYIEDFEMQHAETKCAREDAEKAATKRRERLRERQTEVAKKAEEERQVELQRLDEELAKRLEEDEATGE